VFPWLECIQGILDLLIPLVTDDVRPSRITSSEAAAPTLWSNIIEIFGKMALYQIWEFFSESFLNELVGSGF
ncbi:unnamed protein product, partial [Allacma fusca]